MKKLLCFVVSFIMLIACTGCNGCGEKRGYVYINEGRFLYVCEGQYLVPEIISETYDNYRGVIDIKEITKEEFSTANGINVISSDRVGHGDEDKVYYYSISGYVVDKVGNRTDIKYKNLKEKEKPYVYTIYYEDDYGNEIYLKHDILTIKYSIKNVTAELCYSMEGRIIIGKYKRDSGFDRLTILKLNKDKKEERELIENGANIVTMQDDQGEKVYLYIYLLTYTIDGDVTEFIFEDLKYEYKEGFSKNRYIDKNGNVVMFLNECIIIKIGNVNKAFRI